MELLGCSTSPIVVPSCPHRLVFPCDDQGCPEQGGPSRGDNHSGGGGGAGTRATKEVLSRRWRALGWLCSSVKYRLFTKVLWYRYRTLSVTANEM